MKTTIISLCTVALFAVLGTSCSAPKPEKTIQNLQNAITGETNASAKYAAFSQKAMEEGHVNIAKLFAATSKAEALHVANHKKVLEKLGVQFEGVVEPITVGTTAENIQAGIEGETYEVNNMYPEFITVAETESVTDAATSFNWAMAAEKKHAELYAQALELLNTAGNDSTFSAKWLVCPKCGDTYSEGSDATACNICGTAVENFIVIE